MWPLNLLRSPIPVINVYILLWEERERALSLCLMIGLGLLRKDGGHGTSHIARHGHHQEAAEKHYLQFIEWQGVHTCGTLQCYPVVLKSVAIKFISQVTLLSHISS